MAIISLTYSLFNILENKKHQKISMIFTMPSQSEQVAQIANKIVHDALLYFTELSAFKRRIFERRKEGQWRRSLTQNICYSVCERSLKRKLFFISLQRFDFLINNVTLSLKITINIQRFMYFKCLVLEYFQIYGKP